MERRIFLIRSSQATLSVAASSLFVGCGGGSGGESSSSEVKLSQIDQNIEAINAKQDKIFKTHTDVQNNLNFTDVNDFYVEATHEYLIDGSFPENYLLSQNSNQNLWENAKGAHQIAFDQYNHQYAKFKAVARLFDYKNNNSQLYANNTPSSISQKSVSDANELILLNLLKYLKQYISTENFEAIENIMISIFDFLNKNMTKVMPYAFLIYPAIDELLTFIKNKNLSTLNFSSAPATLLSLAKITVAVMSILALAPLQKLKAAQTASDTDKEAMQDYLINNKLERKISDIWMGVSSKTTLSTIDELKQNVELSIQNDDIENKEILIANLKLKSQILTMASVTIQYLFGKLFDTSLSQQKTAFTSGSTADTYKILFASDKNPYDEALSQTVHDNAIFEDFVSDYPQVSNSKLPKFFSLNTDSRDLTSQTESDAYLFASKLAEFAYNFTDSTQSDAAQFATHLADLAYAFTMKIEEDAYQFAMQGMEYGYLFASRGEEVGLMADRILWMAVQIGVMADRIGEMADRIVYTEQLIVYTEILILDFGILIYGFGSQITNMILTGMALILDREWYTPQSNDIILETINSHVSVMLDQMHTYSLSMLEHQNDLRELTLQALGSLPPYSQE